MKTSSSLLLSLVLALFCCSTVYSFSARSPHRKAGILGQEEIGPIDNYTCTEEGLFPHDDCLYFITCWNKQPVLWTCTEEMLYDLRYKGCEYAENVDCGDRRRPPDFPGTRTPPTSSTTPDPSAPTTTSGPTTPPPNGTFDCPDNGAFPHEERCEYYWDCWEGVASLFHCQLDYLFDLTYDGCNFPDMVDCGTRQRPPDSTTKPPATTTTPPATTTTAPTTTPPTTTTTSEGTSHPTDEPTTRSPTTRNPGDFQCPEHEGRFPDPEDCTAFYDCVRDVPTHYFCPSPLHFSPVLRDCDWPENAGCESQNL